MSLSVIMNVYTANPGEDWMNSGPIPAASVKHEYFKAWGSMQYILKLLLLLLVAIV